VAVGAGGLEEVGGNEVLFEGDGLHEDSDAGELIAGSSG
jgi:hypothetical protein